MAAVDVEADEYYTVDYSEPVKALQGQVCDRSVQLLGPKSPLESEMYSALVQNSKSAITIDAHSVNNVLLTPLQQVSFCDRKEKEIQKNQLLRFFFFFLEFIK